MARIAGVAQLAAHLSCKQGVSGSSPLVGSYFFLAECHLRAFAKCRGLPRCHSRCHIDLRGVTRSHDMRDLLVDASGTNFGLGFGGLRNPRQDGTLRLTEGTAMSRRLLADLRSIKALELAEQGENYDVIAEHLGYADRSGAWRAVMRGLRWRGELAVNFYRLQRVADLDAKQAAAWPAAKRGNIRAAQKVLGCIEGRMRLLEEPKQSRSQATRRATNAARRSRPSTNTAIGEPPTPGRSERASKASVSGDDRTDNSHFVAAPPIVVERDSSWFESGW